MKRTWVMVAGLTAATGLAQPTVAEACGCFAPPNVATPVVQAGEQILFAHEGNQVIAYIKIQYSGAALDFGWLVPLPSVPTLKLGSDELFTKLTAATQPTYTRTTTVHACQGQSQGSVGCSANEASGRFGGAVFDGGLGSINDLGQSGNPVVVQSSIGPYDYAVLKADDQTAMLGWLQNNHYFVPDATGQAVAPYIHPGAYFLALKLRAGQSAGDVVPVVLRYTSDLPMIPITLTQVGAVEDMGVFVWVLGEHRAVPRNYHHVVLDDLPFWGNNLTYPDLVKNAVHAAPKRHAFVTEYAGTSRVMDGQLVWEGRFGDLTVLRTLTDGGYYIQYLSQHGYVFDSTLFAILERYLPEPGALLAGGISEAQFYGNYDHYTSSGGGASDAGPPPTFDPAALTHEIDQRIVQPAKETAVLFAVHPYLTRLLTVISPADMSSDPVFNENPDLPDVKLAHTADVVVPCKGPQWIITDQGLTAGFPIFSQYPAALRIEAMRDAGPPLVEVDNQPLLLQQIGHVDTSDPSAVGAPQGCVVGRRAPDPTVLLALALVALGAQRVRRWRRDRR